jgi:shikimate kinase
LTAVIDWGTFMVVTLIGYRGTGKSGAGRILAARLGWDWCDADDQIEQTAGMTIQEIFDEKNVAGFREIEREVMHRLLAGARPLDAPGLVVSAGGGAVLHADTRREMHGAGPVVWLTATPTTILSRLAADASTRQRRPNLTNLTERDEVESVLREREPLYRACADVIVETDGRTLDEIVEAILRALEPRLAEGAAG